MSAIPITHTKPGRWDGCKPATNDERRADWAARYFANGHHRMHEQDSPRAGPSTDA